MSFVTSTRVTDRAYRDIQAAADFEGLTVAEFIRQAALVAAAASLAAAAAQQPRRRASRALPKHLTPPAA